ncbi:MAG: ABC transporter substrate-binding protein [Clostridia bacterium]|nr:ABC transporter substrate-binding protein [Clostridia bacterium]
MKNVFKKVVATVMAVATMATAAFSMASCNKETNYAENNTTYKIGVFGPLTGAYAIYGQATKNGAQLAVDEINKNGGLNGVNFELMSYDDQGDSTMVNSGYANMYENGMQASLGCTTSGACMEFSALSAQDNVFFLTPSASGDDVTTLGDNSYQMCFKDGNQGGVAAEYVNSLGVTKIGVFYKSGDVYSQGIFEQFKSKLNSSIETVEASFINDSEDFTNQVDKLKDCSFIFMPTYYEVAQKFMAMAKGKVADDATYYGCDGFDGINVDGVPQKVTMLSHFNSKATEGKAKEFIDNYTAKYGAETLNQFGAAAYDCVYAIYGAMKNAGDKVSVTMSASELCEVLKAEFNGGYTFSGVTGTDIKWQADGTVNKAAIAYVVKDADKPETEE